MRKYFMLIIIALVTALGLTVYGAVAADDRAIDNVAAISNGGSLAYLACYQGDSIALLAVDHRGVAVKELNILREQGGRMLSIADMDVDDSGIVYILYDLLDPLSGKLTGQQLALYDLNKIFRRRIAAHELHQVAEGLSEEPLIPYRWLSVTSAAILMGVDQTQTVLFREAYEIAGLKSREMPPLASTRSYNLAPGEGIYDVCVSGSRVAYISGSGKVFLAEEGAETREVYPARSLTEVMYPIFIASSDSDAIYMGEQESGNLVTLDLNGGTTALFKSGTESFPGGGSYTPADVRAMSMTDWQNFSALARNKEGGGFCLLLSNNGQTAPVTQIRTSVPTAIKSGALRFLGWSALLFLISAVVVFFVLLLRNGRTLRIKLVISILPIFAVALVLFGVFSYRSYSASIESSFSKQVEDEGNMLTALFGTESFDEIEYPYDYTGEAYTYLKAQMASRELHSATAYYERDQLFVGVDSEYPCFYPFDIRLNTAASELYTKAAFSGQTQIGHLDDAAGRRLVCVTPIGGRSGKTVYLLETGVPIRQAEQYTSRYLYSYLLVAVLFVVAIGTAMILVISRMLRPIDDIKTGLEEFALGKRWIRLDSPSTDELADIVRVFNKMAGDLDAQLYTLQRTGDTYYRFIPPRMLQLLGVQNLDSANLGTGVQGEYCVLCTWLDLNSEGLDTEQEREIVENFFSILHTAVNSHDAMLLMDSSNLRRTRILCPDGDEAVAIAYEALGAVDAANVALPIRNQMKVMFLLHQTDAYYGISGDENRLTTVLLSRELDALSERAAELRRYMRRFLVTGAALEGFDQSRYAHRLIGYPEGNVRQALALYDFYEVCSPEETRLIRESLHTFEKAMELYLAGRWYDAKNLFAMVLRQNQYDNVTRHYIFLCEGKLKSLT